MFSTPAPIAVADNGPALHRENKVKANKGEDGKPITGLSNMKTKKRYLGRVPDQEYFSPSSYVAVGNPFIMAAK